MNGLNIEKDWKDFMEVVMCNLWLHICFCLQPSQYHAD